MKELKKGMVSIDATGKVKVSGYEVEFCGLNLVETVAEQLHIDKEKWESKEFYGRVTVTVENLEEEPTIENTMFEPESIKTEPLSFEDTVSALAHAEVPHFG